MTRNRFATVLVCAVICSVCAATALGNSLILNVPDWDQPGTSVPAVPGYPNWCAPTAGANLMGYWEDINAKAGLTDGQAFPLGPAFPNQGLWMQDLFNDGAVEMGWLMNTGNWPPAAAPDGSGTQLVKIKPGLTAFAQSAWADPGGPNKLAYSVTVTEDSIFTQPPIWLATMWTNYTNEIDNNRPVLCSFDMWVANATGVIHNVGGQQVHEYNFGGSGAHTVVGVGYLDPIPGQLGDEWFIAQDNWPNTPRYVAVPLIDNFWGGYNDPGGLGRTVWQQNDYLTIGNQITDIPEPGTLVLTVLGMTALLRYGRRRRLQD